MDHAGVPVRRRFLAFVGWLLLCFAPSATAVFVSTGSWYSNLHKPSWNPPSWLFGPVWTTLYGMMAVAAWLVWLRGGWKEQRIPLGWFLAQLILNALWTPIFFGLHELGWAFVEILFLLSVLMVVIVLFFRVSRAAGILLVPYLAWTGFAAFLNFTIWRLNS